MSKFEQKQQQSQYSEALAKLDTSRRDSHSEQMDRLRSMADNISSIASQVASQASGGSWKPSSGRNSPVVAATSARGSPQTGYLPRGPIYTPSQAYGLSNPPRYNESREADPILKDNSLSEAWSYGNMLRIDQLSSETMRCLFYELERKDNYIMKDLDKGSALPGLKDEDTKSNAEVDDIMVALRSLESSTDAESSKALYRIACLIEEVTVSEFSQRLSQRNYQPADHGAISRANAVGAFPASTCGSKSSESFIYGHFVAQPPITASKGCMSCMLNAKMMLAYTDLAEITLHLNTDYKIYDIPMVEETL
ncbi:hypothetical protein NLG97_g1364 [Lecanicillium saksenae]|uniref:Uncharacterized protein n=1 Tax=Lecanicillium saksenae TaxID=468837 RepID=A0ACC1R3Y7_9HYPO|nr:hypothetical protein NLG97_g1364 [Lecanicillium saksenae]